MLSLLSSKFNNNPNKTLLINDSIKQQIAKRNFEDLITNYYKALFRNDFKYASINLTSTLSVYKHIDIDSIYEISGKEYSFLTLALFYKRIDDIRFLLSMGAQTNLPYIDLSYDKEIEKIMKKYNISIDSIFSFDDQENKFNNEDHLIQSFIISGWKEKKIIEDYYSSSKNSNERS